MRQDAALELSWTRRARGQWRWDYAEDVPLIEATEKYLVGFGPADQPYAVFQTDAPQLTLSASEVQALVTDYGAGDLWVRQVGTYSNSAPLWLTQID